MSEQEENELICEKLLGWKRHEHNGGVWWELPAPTGEYASSQFRALKFTTWADAGLILDALSHRCVDVGNLTDCWYCDIDGMLPTPNAPTGPLAVRAAALKWIRNLP